MKIEELKDYGHLEKYVSENEKVVVSVRPKGGCPICEEYAPHFEKAIKEITEKRNDFKIVILYIDDECIEKLDICSPTLLYYRNGKEIKRRVVEQTPLEEFEDAIKKDIMEVFD